MLLCERLAGRRIEFQRVDRPAVFPNAEVQVRAGGGARCADIADELALVDAAARSDARGKAREVHIATLIAAHMLDPDAVAAAGRVPSAGAYRTVANCVHRGACRSGVVNGGVGLDLAGYGMLAAVGEFAADAVVFERRLEEHPLEAFAALVPIGPLAQAAVVEHCGNLLALCRGEEAEVDGVDGDDLAFADALAVDDVEFVAFLKGEEVDPINMVDYVKVTADNAEEILAKIQ